MKYRFLELFKFIAFFVILSAVIIFIDFPYFKNISNIKKQFSVEAENLNLHYNSKLDFNGTLLEYNRLKKEIVTYDNAFLKQGEELNFIKSLEQLADKYQLEQKIELDPNIQPINDKLYRLDLRLNLSGNYYKLLQYLNELKNYKYKIVIKFTNLANKGDSASLTVLASTNWLYDQTQKN